MIILGIILTAILIMGLDNSSTPKFSLINQFKKATHHKKVFFMWQSKDGCKQNKYEIDKFYCNKNYQQKMLSMPSFGLSMENVFYKTDDGFKAISKYGTTIFKIIKGA